MTDLAGSAHYDRIAAAHKPLVTVSCRVPGYDTCAVLPDNQGGARQAVSHLVAHGHRRIAFAGSTRQADVRERYEGYKEGLRDAGIEPAPALFYEAGSARELDGRDTRCSRRKCAARRSTESASRRKSGMASSAASSCCIINRSWRSGGAQSPRSRR